MVPTMLTGVTLDTTQILAAGALVIGALAAVWAIKRVIGIFNK